MYNLGVRWNLHIFCTLLKVLDVVKKRVEVIMCFLGVIEGFYSSGFYCLEQSTLLYISSI